MNKEVPICGADMLRRDSLDVKSTRRGELNFVLGFLVPVRVQW